jgi:uncharacterized repeat protein (TIGR02543 family)
MDKKKKIMLLIVTVLTAVLILAACNTTFKVSFDVNGGSPVAEITVDKKSLLNESSIPTPQKEYFTFAGWYKDKALSKPWEFSKDKVNKNLTLYAKYVEIPSVFSFSLNADGQSYTVAVNPTGSLGILGKLVIPETYSGKPVTAIAADGFSGSIPSKIITEVEIPASVVSIGEKAFYKCIYLNKVTFKGNSALKEIGASAFEGIPLLASVQFPATLQTIGEAAFKDNLALKTAAFDGGSVLKSIGKGAFQGCILLENAGVLGEASYVLPASLVSVGDDAFRNDARLKNTGFASNSVLETVGSYAFYKTSFASLFLPKTLTTVGSYAFAENQSLVSAIFEENSVIEIIPGYMFSNCLSLSAIELPATVKTINTYAFQNTKALKKVVLNSYISDYSMLSNSRMLETDSKATAIIVPKENLADYKSRNSSYSKYIVSIDDEEETASSYTKIIDNSYLVYVVTVGETKTSSVIVYFGTDKNVVIYGDAIPEYPLKSIDKFAFAGSWTLESVEIRNATDYKISDSAFASCANLAAAKLTDVKEIGASAFKETGLTTVNLGSTLEKIGDSAFQYCKKLTSVSIPDSAKTIDGHAFEGCSSLASVSIAGNNLEKIGESVFYNDAALASVNLPDSVTSIGAGAFWNCSSLQQITLPSNLAKIQTLTFAAAALIKIEIPSNVAEIESNAFLGCSALFEITFAENSSLKTIGEYAFAIHSDKSRNYQNAAYNKFLHSVTLPSSVETVGKDAFGRTMIKVITINSVINAKDGVPDISASLLTLNGRVILIDDNAGQEVYDAYKNAESYKNNAFVVKASENLDGFILASENGTYDILVAYVGTSANPDLSGIRIIGSFAFAYNINLFEIAIPINVGVIGESAFESCINLEAIDFAKKDLDSYSIYKNAFKNCSNAGINNEVVIRGTVTFIGAYAFSGWTGDQTIHFEEGVVDDMKGWASNWYVERLARVDYNYKSAEVE